MQLCSAQEICTHVTNIAKFDWSAVSLDAVVCVIFIASHVCESFLYEIKWHQKLSV